LTIIAGNYADYKQKYSMKHVEKGWKFSVEFKFSPLYGYSKSTSCLQIILFLQ